ncbi:197_t:CDS:2 [Cetraspora pellucida]|uniref:197_t:CDS:1 n=1 Tax=Cetraspora pellucida TaxID=1433469 RepID=A0A9N8YWH1_9GLOM|nr:197_t:CDS:2 [Cetraspora pellucida]
MGCCSSRTTDEDSFEQDVNSEIFIPRGGNKPFSKKGVTWASETPITIRQLKKQREAFWETAPSYEVIIWDALRHACESNDLEYAQLILNAAKITIPTGNLVDGCYDELGNRYVIPAYCLVDPTNLIRDVEEGTSEHGDEMNPDLLLDQSSTEQLPIIIRLSSSAEDVQINVNPKIDTIDTLRIKLCENQKIDSKKFIIRFFFLGSLLDGKTKLADVKFDQGQVLQALISEIP